MAISKVQSKKLLGDVGVLAFDSDNTAGNLLIVVVGGQFELGSPLTFSYSDSLGNTSIAKTQRVSDIKTSQMFLVPRCKAGPNTVTITCNLRSISFIAIHEFSGVNSFDQNSAGTGTGLSQDSGAITTTVADELLFGYEFGGQATITPGDVTWTTAEFNATSFLTQFKVVSSIGTYNSTTTATASKSGVVEWIEEIISFWEAPVSTFDAALSVPAVAISGVAWVPVTGDAALEVPKVGIAVAGQDGVNAAIALTILKVTESATAQVGVQFAGAMTLKKALILANSNIGSSPAGSGEPELAESVNEQTGTSYAIRHSDREHLITFKNSAPVAVTIPEATGAFGVGWRCAVQNEGAGTVTITPAAGTINGASSQAFTTNQGAWIWSAGDGKWKIEGDLT